MHPTMKRVYEAAREAGKIPGVNPQAELARLLDAFPQTVSNWERRGVSRDGLLAIQKAVGCDAHWISTGQGAKFLAGTRRTESDAAASDDVAITQYDTGGAGGTGVLLRDQPGVIQHWRVSRDWLRANVPHCTGPQNLHIVTGFGDSMPDTYNPGDPVLVDTGVTVCDHDGVYFFRVGEEGFIKRLQRIPGQGIRVLSQNKEYEPWTITPDMDFQVFGKVLKAWKGKTY